MYDIVASNNYVVLSSGIKDLWSDIANAKNLGTIFASPYISADVKYYVVKQLDRSSEKVFLHMAFLRKMMKKCRRMLWKSWKNVDLHHI